MLQRKMSSKSLKVDTPGKQHTGLYMFKTASLKILNKTILTSIKFLKTHLFCRTIKIIITEREFQVKSILWLRRRIKHWQRKLRIIRIQISLTLWSLSIIRNMASTRKNSATVRTNRSSSDALQHGSGQRKKQKLSKSSSLPKHTIKFAKMISANLLQTVLSWKPCRAHSEAMMTILKTLIWNSMKTNYKNYQSTWTFTKSCIVIHMSQLNSVNHFNTSLIQLTNKRNWLKTRQP